MSTSLLFIKASRKKYRFPSKSGLLTVEQLWELPLTSKSGPSLDDTSRRLLQTRKDTQEESLIPSASTTNIQTEDLISITKYVIDTRMAENAAKLEARQVAERKSKIRQIIARKQDQALEEMDEAALKRELDALES